MTQQISIDSDNVVSVDRLRDSGTDAYVNDATVTFTLYDSAGTAVTGATDVSMPYTAASDGRYEGTLQDTVALSVGGYTLEIVANQAGRVRTWRVPCQASYTATD